MECDQCGNATRIRLAGENQLSMVYTVKKLEPHLKYWIPRGRLQGSDSAKANIAGNFSTIGPAN